MRPKRSASETLRVIEESADADEVERILGLSDEELDRELADDGFDPKAVRARGAEMAAKLGIAVPAEAAVVKVAPVTDIARARRIRVAWLAAAAIAAGAVLVGVPSVVMTVANRDRIGPDNREASVETNEMRAAAIRRDAVAACEELRWEPCERGLDTAKALDPAGDERAEVKKARRAIQDARVPPKMPRRFIDTK